MLRQPDEVEGASSSNGSDKQDVQVDERPDSSAGQTGHVSSSSSSSSDSEHGAADNGQDNQKPRRPTRKEQFARRAASQKLIRSAHAQLQPTVLQKKTLAELMQKVLVAPSDTIRQPPSQAPAASAGRTGDIVLEDSSDSDNDHEQPAAKAALGDTEPTAQLESLDQLRSHLRHKIALQNIKKRQKMLGRIDSAQLPTPQPTASTPADPIPATKESGDSSDDEPYLCGSEEEEEDESSDGEEAEGDDEQEAEGSGAEEEAEDDDAQEEAEEEAVVDAAPVIDVPDAEADEVAELSLLTRPPPRKRAVMIVSDDDDDDDNENESDPATAAVATRRDTPRIAQHDASDVEDDSEDGGGGLTDLCVPTPPMMGGADESTQEAWARLRDPQNHLQNVVQERQQVNMDIPSPEDIIFRSPVQDEPDTLEESAHISLPLLGESIDKQYSNMNVGYMTADGLLQSQPTHAPPSSLPTTVAASGSTATLEPSESNLSAGRDDSLAVDKGRRRLVSRRDIIEQEEAQVEEARQYAQQVGGFIEQEAQESEDEFMGLGGEDGEDSDDDDAVDEIIAADNAEEAAQGAEDVKALAAKQMFDEEQAAIKKLEHELMSGGLGMGRRHQMDMWGKGYGLEDMGNGNNGDTYMDEEQRRRAMRKKRRTVFNSTMERYAECPETAAFVQAFVPVEELDDFVPPEPENFVSVELEGESSNALAGDEQQLPQAAPRSHRLRHHEDTEELDDRADHLPTQPLVRRSRPSKSGLLEKSSQRLQRYILQNVHVLNLDKGGVKTSIKADSGKRTMAFHHQLQSAAGGDDDEDLTPTPDNTHKHDRYERTSKRARQSHKDEATSQRLLSALDASRL
ncbi:hypothetical protein RI367_000369 [Sorochytrium milnesiophthora]